MGSENNRVEAVRRGVFWACVEAVRDRFTGDDAAASICVQRGGRARSEAFRAVHTFTVEDHECGGRFRVTVERVDG